MALDPRNSSYAESWQRSGTAAGADIDVGLRRFMLRTYNLMALGVAWTAVVTLFMSANPALMQTVAVGPLKWVLFIGLLGMGFFANRIISMQSTAMAHAFFWVYATLWGLLISPMVAYFLAADGGSMVIARAFFITAGMFAGMSLFGYTTKRDLSGFGRFAMMAMIGIVLAGLVNVIFVESTGFALIVSIGTVLLFAGVTAWETQQIKNTYLAYAHDEHAAGRLSIFGALLLYGSFVIIFVNLLQIFGIMGGDE